MSRRLLLLNGRGNPARRYLAAMTDQPSEAVATAIREFIGGLIEDGDWQHIAASWIMNLHTEQASRVCVQHPTRFALVNVGSPTWATGVGGAGGFTGDGAAAALDTGWDATTDGGVFRLGSAGIVIRSWTSADSNNYDIGDGQTTFMRLSGTTNFSNGRVVDGNTENATATVASGAGLFGMDNDGTSKRFYFDGVQVGSDIARTPTSLGTNDFYILSSRITFSARRVSFAAITGYRAGLHARIAARLATFETAIGAS